VSVAAEVKRMVAQVEAQLGAIDILVNNAAIAHPGKLEEITEAEWDEVLTVNLKSVFLATAPSCRWIGTTAEGLGYASLSRRTHLGVLSV
jgi:3-oxoacyl-[acyl-carrier protein] reductase